MSVALYMDEQIDRAITEALRGRGIDVLTVQEDGHTGAPDPVVIARATELGRIIFSQDSDMLGHASSMQRHGTHFAGLAYAHPLRITIGQAIASLELLAKTSDPPDMTNRVEYLPY